MLKKVIIILFLLLINHVSAGQSAGPNDPTSSGTNNSVGTFDWNNPDRVYASDNSRARANNLNNGDDSYYLTATNFSFSIPASSVIDGIVVEIERSDNGGGGNIKDNVVKIIKGGSIVGTDNSAGGNWPSSDSYRTYGSSTDLWGTTWTEADINASNFGVAISIRKTGGGGTNDARIDHIRITVYYSSTLPIELIAFTGEKKENTNSIEWVVATQINNDKFILQKSDDAVKWFTVNEQKGAGTTSKQKTYNFVDVSPFEISYYRLTQLDYNGRAESFGIIAIENSTLNSDSNLHLYPNPSQALLVIETKLKQSGQYTIRVINDEGKILYTKELAGESGTNAFYFDTSILKSGAHIIQIKTNTEAYSDKFFKQ